MGAKPPCLALALSEAPRALLDFAVLGAARPLLRAMPGAKPGHSVMVIPGFLGDDLGNGPLIRYLNELGYIAAGWGQGRNLGPSNFEEANLRANLERLVERGDGQVSLVGHSLGGIYAREIARMEPDTVRMVITLGSPFGRGQESGSHASRMYRRLNPGPQAGDDRDSLSTPPPVPTTAIFTRGDGVVNWRTSLQDGDHEQVRNIQVPGSHVGLNVNAAVWYWVARQLAEAAD